MSSKVGGDFICFFLQIKDDFPFLGFLCLPFNLIGLFLLKPLEPNILVVQKPRLFILDFIMKRIDRQVMRNAIVIIHPKTKQSSKWYLSSSSVRYIFKPVARLVIYEYPSLRTIECRIEASDFFSYFWWEILEVWMLEDWTGYLSMLLARGSYSLEAE